MRSWIGRVNALASEVTIVQLGTTSPSVAVEALEVAVRRWRRDAKGVGQPSWISSDGRVVGCRYGRRRAGYDPGRPPPRRSAAASASDARAQSP
jgi:hypothetical protein